MNDFQENIVPAQNQNTKDFFVLKEGSGLSVLFVGNSIAKHAPRPEIGWYRDCGMAASCEEKDYVHLLMSKIQRYHPDAAFALLSASHYATGFYEVSPQSLYGDVPPFKPDVVFMFFGANVSFDYDTDPTPTKTFGSAYEDLRNYWDTPGKTVFFHSEGFYIRPNLDAEKKQVSDKYGDTFITLEGIREVPESHGEFNHPGDWGMEQIASRFWEASKSVLTVTDRV